MQQKKSGILLGITALIFLNQTQAALPQALISKYPSATIQENKITLRAPEIAEEGSVVPVRIRAISLPDKDTYITELSFYSASNTNCPISRYTLTANMLGEGLGTNIRLPASTHVYAIAKLSNGDIISGRKNIKVTIGGCGGGSPLPGGSAPGDYCLKK